MKKILAYIIPLCMAVSSCDFLGENPESFASRGDFFKTEQQCVSAVNSVYNGIKNVYNYQFFTHVEGTTDLICAPSAISSDDAVMNISPSNCNVSKNVWSKGYKGVMYCNFAIAGIEESPIDKQTKMELLSEAKTMRAYWYYLLTSTFGNVPFYTEDVSSDAVMNKIAKYGRMSAYEARKTLVEDLQSCFPYDAEGQYSGALPQIKTSEMAPEDVGRAGWAMGMTLIGKLALWNAYDKDHPESAQFWFQTAKDALEKVEAVYGDLSQYTLEDLKFKYKNTAERIFEIQHTYVSGQLSYYSNLAPSCLPSYNKDTNKFDGVEIPELGTEFKSNIVSKPTKYFYQEVQPKGGDDLRIDLNMGIRYNGKEFTNGKTTPWMGPKFWCPNMYQDRDDNNYPIFRYADVVLMIAECCCGLADEEGFETRINSVRSRAGLAPYTFNGDWTIAFNELCNERARELFGEFQRKFDLVRWGIWYDTVLSCTDFAQLKQNIKPCHRFLPIHDTQVAYSGYNLDNDEYKQYGL